MNTTQKKMEDNFSWVDDYVEKIDDDIEIAHNELESMYPRMSIDERLERVCIMLARINQSNKKISSFGFSISNTISMVKKYELYESILRQQYDDYYYQLSLCC